jgi:heme/copper-type cytochrome/quinol oxidase subunit 2
MWHSMLAETAPTMWLSKGASTIAPGVDLLFNWILWICIFFFFLVTILLVLFVVLYRHKPGVKRDVAAGHNTPLELTWTLVPSVIVVFLYYYGFRQYMNMAIEPPNSYEIMATGQMWQWSFTYPNGHTDTELHVPIDTPIRIVLQSQDVIHSLYIPNFRVKKDAVPGRYNRMWFEANSANYAVYLASINVNGHATEVAVDSEGTTITSSREQTPKLETVAFDKSPAPVQAALKALATDAKVPIPQSLPTLSLCNGSTLYLTGLSGGPQRGEVVLDANGSPATEVIEFGSTPAAVQSSMTAAVGGASIARSQPVRVFQDAEPFDIYCTAYCGTNHSTMRSRAIVHRTRADFDRWLAEAAQKDNSGPPEEKGKRAYFRYGCAGCHTIDATKLTGPSWKDLWGKTENLTGGQTVKVDEPYIIESIRQPGAKIVDGYQNVMPVLQVTDADIQNIIAFMKTISSHTSAAEMPGATTGPATTNPASAPTTRPIGLLTSSN